MKKFVKSVAAICAAAVFMGSVPIISLGAETDAKSVSIAPKEGVNTVKITTEETTPFDGVVIYAVYEGQSLSSVEAKEFKSISSEQDSEVQFDKAYTKASSKLFVWNSLSEMVPYNVTVVPEKVQIATAAKVEISGDTTAPSTLTATVSAINDSGFDDINAFTYEWKKGEETLQETGATLANATEGNYTVTATYTGTGNYEGSITTAAPYVVSPAGDTRVDITGDETVSVSISASSQTAPSTLTAQISAGEKELAASDFTYVWSRNGSPISGGENGTLEDAQAGDYTVVATVKSDNVSYKGSTAASQSVTIKAVYTVIFNADGGSSVNPAQATDGEPVAQPETPTKEHYDFAGWYKETSAYDFSTPVTDNITLTAHWTIKQYTVTFDTDGGNAIQAVTQDYNTTTTLPTPTKDGYTFVKWNDGTTDYSAGATYTITGNVTITASWTENQADTYTVRWLDDDNSELYKDENIASGTATPTHPDPTKAESEQYTYTFTGWTPAVAATVTDNATYKATYSSTKNKYKITWVVEGKDNKEQDVEYGEIPDYGETPTRTSTAEYTYTFKGWSPEITAVSKAQTYTATWNEVKNTYTVTWKSQDGNSTIETDENVAYGVAPSFDGTTPTKDETAEKTYTFEGWATTANQTTGTAANSLDTVSGNVTYYAAFSEAARKYTITWKDGDNTLKTEQVAYGETPEYSGEALTRTGYSYTWSPTITSVTGDATYTTKWTINKYTITNNSATDDGNANHGTIALSGLDGDNKAEYNSTITVTPTADDGYELKKITVEAEGARTATYTGAADDGNWKFTVPAATAGAEVIVTATFSKIAVDAISVEGASSFIKGAAATLEYTAKVTAADGTDITSAYADDIKWTVTGTDSITEDKEAVSLSVSVEQTDSMTVKASLDGLYDTIEVTPVSKITIGSANALHNGNPGNAYDDNESSQWSVLVTDNGRRMTYIDFDLNEIKSVSSVKIYFNKGNERQYDFDIKVSADGTYWNKVGTYKSDGKTNGFETFDFGKTVSAKYVRLVGRGSNVWATNNTNYFSYVEIKEFEVYGPDTAAAQPKKLTVTSAEANYSQNNQPPENAYDGNLATSWNAMIAGSIAKNILTFDLGSKKTVSAVDISFANGHTRNYNFDIETSADGENWNKAGSYVSGAETDKDYERFEFEAVNAQYVRYIGDKAKQYSGNSAIEDKDTGIWYYPMTENIYNAIWEFNVYGSDTANAEPAELSISSAGASKEAADGAAANAFDGKMDTRWAADATAEANKYNTIDFDLGAKKRISAVGISFYLGVQRSYDFDILVSDDKETWTKIKTIKSGAASDKELERFEFGEVEAQYVRYLGRGSTVLQNGAYNNFNSIWEFKVYGYDNE